MMQVIAGRMTLGDIVLLAGYGSTAGESYGNHRRHVGVDTGVGRGAEASA